LAETDETDRGQPISHFKRGFGLTASRADVGADRGRYQAALETSGLAGQHSLRDVTRAPLVWALRGDQTFDPVDGDIRLAITRDFE